jgi:hypothetical protein
MNLNALHRRLLRDVLEIGNTFPLVITGGYAVQAHGLVDRQSSDIDVATNSPVPMPSLVDHVVAALTERGWQVRVIGVDSISARLMVADPGTGEDCEVDLLKEGFNRPPEVTPYGPVLALDDVIGTKGAAHLPWRAYLGTSEQSLRKLNEYSQRCGQDHDAARTFRLGFNNLAPHPQAQPSRVQSSRAVCGATWR